MDVSKPHRAAGRADPDPTAVALDDAFARETRQGVLLAAAGWAVYGLLLLANQISDVLTVAKNLPSLWSFTNIVLLIERGRVKISSGSREGREVVMNLLGVGAIFGEVALIDGGERTADATACDPVGVLVLDRGQLISFLQKDPDLLLRMLVTLTARLRWVSDRFEDVVFLGLPARLAKRLLFLGEHFGVDAPDGRRLTVSLPQRELANHMNVTRETMNRLLQDWQGQGVIEIRRGFIVLKRKDALTAIVDAG